MIHQSVAVVGAGGWGTALALHLHERGIPVTLWARRPDWVAEARRTGQNSTYLPGVPLPAALPLESEPAALARAELLVLAVPTQHLRSILGRIRSALRPGVPCLSVAKGIEQRSLLRPTQVVLDEWPGTPVACLSGPSHAEEVARGLPTTIVAAASDAALARTVQAVFSGGALRVYTNPDLTGVELGGALKNILAIAAGICEGLRLGDNAKASLLARGLVEMARLGLALGAQKSTFFGLSGLGDLLTTAYSPFGRNRGVGLRIGAGEKLPAVLQSMKQVAEGVWTSQAALGLAEKQGVDMPITREIVQILFHGKPAPQGVSDLMGRTPKSESEDLP